jgi:hypothetical protein
MEPDTFGPRGTVFSATVIRISVSDRVPPYGLAYVDLDGGPRILAHVTSTDSALDSGELVVVAGATPDGDPLVRSLQAAAT